MFILCIMYPRFRRTPGVQLAARALWFGQKRLRFLWGNDEQFIGTSWSKQNEVTVVGNRYRDHGPPSTARLREVFSCPKKGEKTTFKKPRFRVCEWDVGKCVKTDPFLDSIWLTPRHPKVVSLLLSLRVSAYVETFPNSVTWRFMPKTSTQTQFDHFVSQQLWPAFKARGYRKTSNNFRYYEASGWGKILHLQKSQHGDRDNIHFTLNIGLYLPEAERLLLGKVAGEKFVEPVCIMRWSS
jgi:hypothetical protein